MIIQGVQWAIDCMKVSLDHIFKLQPNLMARMWSMIILLNSLEFRMAHLWWFNDPRCLTDAFVFSRYISREQAEVFKTISMSRYIQCSVSYWYWQSSQPNRSGALETQGTREGVETWPLAHPPGVCMPWEGSSQVWVLGGCPVWQVEHGIWGVEQLMISSYLVK